MNALEHCHRWGVEPEPNVGLPLSTNSESADLFHAEGFSAKRGLGLAYEIDVGAMRDDSAVEANVQKLLDRFSAVWAVVERAVVDVHSDEAVGKGGIEVASKLHSISEGLFAVVEGVLDTVAQGIGCA